MATFTDCADNLTCATLSGSNGIGVGLVTGTPNKIVVSASNVPNSALANSLININGITIALGASGSIAVGSGTVTSVTAGTNLSASGTSTDPVINLTGNITSGLTSITGLTNVSSNAVTGTNILATNINTTTITGSVSGSHGEFTYLTASNISSSTITGSISGTSGQFVSLTGSNIYSNTLTGSISGTNGQLGNAIINTLTSTNITSSTISGTFSGSGASIINLTASHINHFQEDVRSQFTAGTGINILLGQISVANVPNSSLANTGSVIGSTAVVLGTTVPSLAGLTSVAATTGSFSILSGTVAITGALGQFNTLTGSRISSSNYFGLTGSSVNFPNFQSDVRKQISGVGSISYDNNTGIISYTGGGGTVTSVTAGTNLSSSGTSTAPILNLTSSITGGLTNISGTTTITSVSGNFTRLTGSNISGTNNLLVGGNVGIGTPTPAYKLDVVGTGRFTSNVEVTGTIKSTSTIYAPGIDLSSSTGYANIEIGGPSGGHIDLKRPYTDDYDIRLISDNNIEGGGYLIASGGAILALSGTGVAVGQYSNAGYKLLVAGTTRLADAVEIGQGGTLRLYDNATQVVVQYPNKQVSFYDSTNTATRMLIDTNGNVGIGTTTPTYNLHVRSTGSSTLYLESDTLNTNPPEANAKILLSQDGGISTANYLMTSASDGQNDLIIGVNSTTSPSIHFALSSSGTQFLTSSTAAKMSILNNGNVGIGTTSPVAKLEVNGSGALFTDTANTSIFTNPSKWQTQIHRDANLLTLAANGRDAGHLVLTAPEYFSTDPVGFFASPALYMGVYSATNNPGYSWIQSATTASTPAVKNLYLNPVGGGINMGGYVTTVGGITVGGDTYTNNGTLNTRNINIDSGYGIIFNATNAGGLPSPTISSNTLSDYEHGIWTPKLYNATTAQDIDLAGATYAKYTKIGNKVFLLVDITIFSAGNFTAMANGSLRITNLPYSWDGSIRGRASCFYYTSVAASLTSAPFGMVEGNYVVLFQHASLGISNLAKVDLTNMSRLMFEISYTTT